MICQQIITEALLFHALVLMVVADEPATPQPITRIWLTHKTNDPGKIVVNWLSDKPGDSVVRFGLTDQYGQTVRIDEETTLHLSTSTISRTSGRHGRPRASAY